MLVASKINELQILSDSLFSSSSTALTLTVAGFKDNHSA